MSLPSGYKRLEYIQSSGTQYIDTGFKPNQNTRVKMVIVHTSITGAWQGIMSARDGAGEQYGNNFSLWVTASAAYRSDYGQDEGASGGTAIANTKITIDKNKNIATIGNTELTDNIATFRCNYTLHLLTGWSGGASEYPAYARIYSCQIYDNGTLIRDFIPCKNSAGTVGLWDDVNSKFYANAGTGVFTAGPEVAGTHKARINATDYEIKGGTCTIDATAYKIKKGRTRIDATGYDIALESGTPLSEIPVGNTVKIAVNGTMRDWIVVNQGIPSGSALYDDSCNGTWLLMKDIYEERQWGEYYKNDYTTSLIHVYLNSTFLQCFDSTLLDIIKTVKIPYKKIAYGAVVSGAKGLSCKVFLLSAGEVHASGGISGGFDGGYTEYFQAGNDDSRVAYFNGTATSWWLRTPTGYTGAYMVSETGRTYSDVSVDRSYGIRPAVILPFDTLVSDDGTVLV